MAKFKIQAGAEVDVLSKEELGSTLDEKIRNYNAMLSSGIRYSKVAAGPLSSSGLLQTSTAAPNGYTSLGGPEPGFVWEIKTLIVPNVVASPPNIALYKNDATYYNALSAPVSATTLFQEFDPGSVILMGGSALVVGFSVAAANGVYVVVSYKEVPIVDIGKL